MENKNITDYLTLISKSYYTKVINIVKELENLQDSKIYIYGSFVHNLMKEPFDVPECVYLWFYTDKSVDCLKRVKINDIYFNIVNNKNKPLNELYCDSNGLVNYNA